MTSRQPRHAVANRNPVELELDRLPPAAGVILMPDPALVQLAGVPEVIVPPVLPPAGVANVALSQQPDHLQPPEAGLLGHLAQDAPDRIFPGMQRPTGYLYPGTRKLGVPENKQAIPVGDVGEGFFFPRRSLTVRHATSSTAWCGRLG